MEKRLFALASHGKLALHKEPFVRERVELWVEIEVLTESADDLDNAHRALEKARA